VSLVCLHACVLALAMLVGSAHAEEPRWVRDTGLGNLVFTPAFAYPHPVPPPASAQAAQRDAFSPIQLVLDLANHLRDIRYKRGGREPSTGFDCSGFVRYVFRQGIGAEL